MPKNIRIKICHTNVKQDTNETKILGLTWNKEMDQISIAKPVVKRNKQLKKML